VVLGPGDTLDSQQNMRLRPLRPGEGRFLPAVASLGGALFLEPFGWAGMRWWEGRPPLLPAAHRPVADAAVRCGPSPRFLPTKHDVVRLSPNVLAMKGQQGYVACQPRADVRAQEGCLEASLMRRPPLFRGSPGHGEPLPDTALAPTPHTPQGAVRAPLHCAVTVRLGLQQDAGVASAPNQIEIPRAGHQRRAMMPLEAEIIVSPTLQITNALPYPMELALLALAPQAGDAEDAAAAAALAAAVSGGAGGTPGSATAPPAAGAHGGSGSAAALQGANGSLVSPLQRRGSSLWPVVSVTAGGAGGGFGTPDNALSPRESAAGGGQVELVAAPGAHRTGSVGGRGGGAAEPGVLGGPPQPALPAAAMGRGRGSGLRGAMAWAATSVRASAPGAGRGGAAGAVGWTRLTQMMQERWLRDFMCQELLAALPALSPARRRAVDAPLVALMSYSQLQALALGLLLDDLRWIMRTVPKELAVGWAGQGLRGPLHGARMAAAWAANWEHVGAHARSAAPIMG
jgi:hypothetical protein